MRVMKQVILFGAMFGMVSEVSADVLGWYSLDETSGGVAVDTSGQGYDGIINGEVDLSVAGVGGSTGAGFTNTPGESIVLPERYSGNAARSISLWFDANTVIDQGRLIGSGNSGAAQQFDITLEESTGGISVGVRYGNGNIFWSGGSGGINIDAGFHHMVMTYDGTTLVADDTLKMYIDGVLVTSDGGNLNNSGQLLQTGDGSDDADPFTIALDVSGSRRFDGVIDDVHIFDRAIDAGDVSFLNSNPGQLLIGEPVRLVGDFNNDGVRDIEDYFVWRSNYGIVDPTVADGDANRDHKVDIIDFQILRGIVLDESGVDLANIPEPTSLVLLGLSGAMLVRRKK